MDYPSNYTEFKLEFSMKLTKRCWQNIASMIGVPIATLEKMKTANDLFNWMENHLDVNNKPYMEKDNLHVLFCLLSRSGITRPPQSVITFIRDYIFRMGGKKDKELLRNHEMSSGSQYIATSIEDKSFQYRNSPFLGERDNLSNNINKINNTKTVYEQREQFYRDQDELRAKKDRDTKDMEINNSPYIETANRYREDNNNKYRQNKVVFTSNTQNVELNTIDQEYLKLKLELKDHIVKTKVKDMAMLSICSTSEIEEIEDFMALCNYLEEKYIGGEPLLSCRHIEHLINLFRNPCIGVANLLPKLEEYKKRFILSNALVNNKDPVEALQENRPIISTEMISSDKLPPAAEVVLGRSGHALSSNASKKRVTKPSVFDLVDAQLEPSSEQTDKPLNHISDPSLPSNRISASSPYLETSFVPQKGYIHRSIKEIVPKNCNISSNDSIMKDFVSGQPNNVLLMLQELYDENEKTKITKDLFSECNICFEALQDVGLHRRIALNRGHIFGLKCLYEYTKKTNSAVCSTCNKTITICVVLHE